MHHIIRCVLSYVHHIKGHILKHAGSSEYSIYAGNDKLISKHYTYTRSKKPLGDWFIAASVSMYSVPYVPVLHHHEMI